MKVAVYVAGIFPPYKMTLENIRRGMLGLDEDGPYVIDPNAAAALEMARNVAGRDDEVIAVSYGGLASLAALTYAYAFGIRHVVHIPRDPAECAADPSVPARLVAQWVKQHEFPLVLIGSEVHFTPGLLGGFLGVPSIPQVASVCRDQGSRLEVEQRWDSGHRQRLAAQMPAVLGVVDAGVRTRYVSVIRRRQASWRIRQELTVFRPATGNSGGIRLVSVDPPKPRAKRTALPDARKNSADRLKDLIRGAMPRALAQDVTKEPRQIVELPPVKAAQQILDFLKEKDLLPRDG